MDNVTPIKTPENFGFKKGDQLPDPKGYHILCAIPTRPKEHDNSTILKADQTVRNEEILCTVLFVLKIGTEAYKDKAKFSEPWCKEGDFVIVRPNTGTRIKIYGNEFRLINDDQVEAVVEDPRGISRP